MENKTITKKDTGILCAFSAWYIIVSQILPRLSYIKHTSLSLWIQSTNYIVLGAVLLLYFRTALKDGIIQWKQSPVKNLLWLVGAFAADMVLSSLASVPLTMLFPDYVSINDSSVSEASTLLPPSLLLISFGIFGPVTEEFIFRIIPIKKGKHIPIPIKVLAFSMLFMAIHMHEITIQELLYNLGLFVTGIIYSIALIKTENITIPILIHILNNAPALLLLLVS